MQESFKQNQNNKSSSSDAYNFTVITEYASYIESNDGNFHSYTFPIVREINNGLTENLVLTLQDDNTYKALLMSYRLTEEELNAIKNNVDIDLTDKTTVTEITDSYIINEAVQNRTCGYELEEVCSFEVYPTYTSYDCNTQYVYNCDNDIDGAGTGPGGLPNGGLGGSGGTMTPPVNTDILKWNSFISTLTFDEANLLQTNLAVNFQVTQFLKSNNYSPENQAFAKELLEIVNKDSNIDANALAFVFQAKKQNKIENAFDANFLNSVDQFMDLSNMEVAANTDILYRLFMAKVAVIRAVNPTWSNLKIYWEASKDFVHLTLDVVGLVPIVGEAADLINGAIYLVEGDMVNAGLSASAAVPFAGWAATGSKLAVKVVTLAGGAKALKIIAKNSDEIAALALKLKEKFVLVTQNGISYLKDLTGNIIAQGDDVGRVVGNIADAVNDRQRNVINQHRNTIGNATNKRKGNFGEMASDLDLAEKGYIPLHTRIDNIDQAGHNGIDAVMEKNGQYFIVESKFSSTTTPSLNPANPATNLPKQMSEDWIERDGALANAMEEMKLLLSKLLILIT